MFTNVSGKFAEFALSVLVVFTQLCIPTVKAEKMRVHNATIDIAILYDQSASMGMYINHAIWNEMQEWVRYYFQGTAANETRFAVMGCKGQEIGESVEPALYFDGTTNGKFPKSDDRVQTILNAQEYERRIWGKGVTDNVDGCVRSAREKLFVESKGDRPGARNVVLFISDCELDENEKSHRNQMAELLNMAKAFLFICTESRNKIERCYNRNDMVCWKNMMEWVKNESLIFSFTHREAFVERLNQVLDSREIEVTHCNSTSKLSGCVIHEDKCVVMNYTIVKQHPDPPQYGIPCPKNETVRECDKTECEVTATDTESTVASQETSTGTWTSNVSMISSTGTWMSKITTIEEHDKSKPSPPPAKDEDTSDSAGMSTGVVVGLVVGLLVLLILIIIVIVVVVLSRRKGKKKSQRMKVRGVALQDRHGEEKEKGMRVDFGSRMSTNTGTSGKSTMSKGKEGGGVKSPTTTKSASKRATISKSTPKRAKK